MNPHSILIFGQGQLGVFYREYFEKNGVAVSAPKLDIRDRQAVKQAVAVAKPDIVINCAGKTNVDWCEQNRLECFDINVLGAQNIGRACAEHGTYLVHLSSGCVQESVSADDVKKETDPVNPLCFYGWSKVWAEELLVDLAARGGLKTVILRPRQLLSSAVSPRNVLTKMLTYAQFVDIPNSCTIVEDLLWVTEALVRKDAFGLINIVNPGIITPYRIAELLKEEIKPDMEFKKITKAELNAMMLVRRVDAVLDTSKLKSFGIKLRPIEERLREILVNFKKNLATESAAAVLAKTEAETTAKLGGNYVIGS